MKKLMFIAAVAASLASFGARMIECGSETKVLSPMTITSAKAASTNLTGTVTLANRVDLSYTTNCLAKVVVTNGWVVQVGQPNVPVINTNTVVKTFKVEKHVDIPVCTLTLASGYAITNGLAVPVAPGDTILVSGTSARTFVYGD